MVIDDAAVWPGKYAHYDSDEFVLFLFFLEVLLLRARSMEQKTRNLKPTQPTLKTEVLFRCQSNPLAMISDAGDVELGSKRNMQQPCMRYGKMSAGNVTARVTFSSFATSLFQ